MDASMEAHLQALSQGECSSRQVREQTGLNYSQMLDALGELGLRLPSFDHNTANEEVKRGYDNLVAYYNAYKEERERASSEPAPSFTADDGFPSTVDALTTKEFWKVTVSSLFPNGRRVEYFYEGHHASEHAACGAALHNEGIDHGGSTIPTIVKVKHTGEA
ncbi:hypothetical protein [Sphingomonas sp. Leaf226]|uniref:hypothetical protein n=1 Tax=Sphingomonas sp. Leaf226 TaxID=1735691 RepID=UPI000B0FF620|nr:hypothetical protein [Sphingomonas sp. Leaf226]